MNNASFVLKLVECRAIFLRMMAEGLSRRQMVDLLRERGVQTATGRTWSEANVGRAIRELKVAAPRSKKANSECHMTTL